MGAGSEVTWNSAPDQLSLSPTVIHVWRSPLHQPPPSLLACQSFLSEDERQRAARFRRPLDRDRFIVARGTLRYCLGQYLDLSPDLLQFDSIAAGKPILASDHHCPPLQFNLSHSGNWLLLAVTLQTPVGIDLEELRPVAELEPLTRRFFSAREHQSIQRLPEAEQLSAFFQHWTAREACLKATGEGLTKLQTLELVVSQDQVQVHRWDGQDLQNWQVRSFVPLADYRAALAVRAPAPEILFFDGKFV